MAIAATEASGAARAAAAKKAADRKAKEVARERAREYGAGPTPGKKTDANGNARFRGEGGKKSRARRGASWAWSGNRKVLTAQFLLCMVILILGTLTGDGDAKSSSARALVKGSALSLLFFLLALLSAGGGSSARTATAMGTLVTAAYALTSSDVHAVVKWIGHFFGTDAKNVGSKTSSAEQDDAVESNNAPEFS